MGGGWVVVALRGRGNATRRMNHSEDSPNVCATVVNHRGVRKVCMRTKADIAQGTELTFSYGRAFKFRCND
jgi:SET domain-containing protein